MSEDKKDRDGPPKTSWASGLQPPDPQTASRNDSEEGGFLRRWSRRKGAQSKMAGEKKAGAAAQALPADFAEPEAEKPLELPPEAPVRGRMITSPPGGAATANDAGTAVQEGTEAEADDADLPDLEEMDAASDFTPFLKKGVSEQLQRKALRKLWLSDPVLANVDGLLDYGDDFTDAAMVIENMKTVYTVGRGMVPKPEEPEAELEAADDAGESPEDEVAAEGATSKDGETEAGENVSEGEGSEDAAPGETPAIAQSHDDAAPPGAQDLPNERRPGSESKMNSEKS